MPPGQPAQLPSWRIRRASSPGSSRGAGAMSGFDARWLDLREPVDRRSRSEELARGLARHFSGRTSTTVLDLGCGTGSNLRATAPLLGAVQHWTLIDHDRLLLEAAIQRLSAWADTAECRGAELALSKGGEQILVRLRSADLGLDLEGVFASAPDPSPPRRCSISPRPTSSPRSPPPSPAPGRLLHRAHLQRRAALDAEARGRCGDGGGIPQAPDGDKGFGAAAGPMAPALLAAAFDAAGDWVNDGDSGWRLEAADEALIAELAAGFAAAVRETGLVPDAKVADWMAVSRTVLWSGIPTRWRCRRNGGVDPGLRRGRPSGSDTLAHPSSRPERCKPKASSAPSRESSEVRSRPEVPDSLAFGSTSGMTGARRATMRSKWKERLERLGQSGRRPRALRFARRSGSAAGS